MTEVHFVLPGDIDDPACPSGGNVYDRRIARRLAAFGCSVHEHAAPGAWLEPGEPELRNLAQVLTSLPDGAVTLVDGLVASAAASVVAAASTRLRLVVLVHMPLGDESEPARRGEREALSAATAVVATSEWSRGRLVDLYGLPAERVHIAEPGVDPAPLAPGSRAGSALLCVGAVAPHKGHDVLAEALAAVADTPWSCVCVGSLSRDPSFVMRLRRQIRSHGLADRMRLVGTRTGRGLGDAYARADLFVTASLGETYGMVVTEALSRGIPVLGTSAKGLPEALGHTPDGERPGMLVPAGDSAALAGALKRWFGEADLRQRLRDSARGRRDRLTSWTSTAERVATVLGAVAAGARS